MRTIRRWLRKLLIRSLGKFGETIILPRVRFLYDQLPLLDWRRKRYAASEARRLLSAMDTTEDRFSIVVDYEVSCLGYGPLIYIIAIARFIIAQGHKVDVFLVEAKAPHMDGIECQEEIDEFINNSLILVEALLNPKHSTISSISANELTHVLDRTANSFLLFDDFTRDRRPFFRDCFNVINYLMAGVSVVEQDRVLYSLNDFPDYSKQCLNIGPFITWHCRYSLKGVDFGRQTLPDEFLAIHSYLKKRFSLHRIIIISDLAGCAHYSRLAAELQIDDLLFSKDYSPDFLGDSSLIMNSDFFFLFRGGGIGTIPLLSRLPYEFIGPVMPEVFWDKKRLTSWQGEAQSFVQLQRHQFVANRSEDLANLGFEIGSVAYKTNVD